MTYLCRISRLILGSVDSTLRVLLPNEASALHTTSLTTQILQSSPASSQSSLTCDFALPCSVFDQLLVTWGRIADANLKNANSAGFVTGVPVLSVMHSSSLVMLEALSSC